MNIKFQSDTKMCHEQDVPAISSQVVSRKSLGLFTHRASNILGITEYRV